MTEVIDREATATASAARRRATPGGSTDVAVRSAGPPPGGSAGDHVRRLPAHCESAAPSVRHEWSDGDPDVTVDPGGSPPLRRPWIVERGEVRRPGVRGDALRAGPAPR